MKNHINNPTDNELTFTQDKPAKQSKINNRQSAMFLDRPDLWQAHKPIKLPKPISKNQINFLKEIC